MMIAVSLRPLDGEAVESLLTLAVADAAPEEVMPPVDGPAGWTPARLSAFRAFHIDRLPGLDGPLRTLMFAIVADGDIAGMIRLSRTEDPTVLETGIWLGRSARGMGIGSSALARLVAEAAAAGASAVVAETTAGNVAAMRALRRHGARLTYPDRPTAAPEAAPVRATIPIKRSNEE
jgi:RimJ/RimL family protein N-acetyltransferase